MARRSGHSDFIDQWLERSAADDLPREDLLDLFDEALRVLWALTSTTLGEVTLSAIADRVRHNAAEAFPAFASLRVDKNGRIQSRDLRKNVESVPRQKLVEGMRFVLVEFLAVLGNLTGGILTPELHAELLAVTPGRAAHGGARTDRAAKVATRDTV